MNLEVFIAKSSARQVEKLKSLKSRYIYYSDFSKTNGERSTLPAKLKDVPMIDVEKNMDIFLQERWSLHEKPEDRWPRIYTRIDGDTELRIVEFPIKVDGIRILSIKKSFRNRGELKALSYRLAEIT